MSYTLYESGSLPPHHVPKEHDLLFTSIPPIERPVDGWCEAVVDRRTKTQIVSQPGFPKPLLHPVTLRCKQAPSSQAGGIGTFATEKTRAGELVFTERPLIMVPAKIVVNVSTLPPRPDDMSEDEYMQRFMPANDERYQVAFERMIPQNQEKFMALHNAHTKDGPNTVLGIVRTNGVHADGLSFRDCSNGLRFGSAEHLESYTAVGAGVARLNHSCSPNVSIKFDLPSFALRVYAVRDIRQGDELFMSYLDTLQPAAKRAEKLAPYGFQCRCLSCTQPTEESDRRRSKICLDIKRANLFDLDHLSPNNLDSPIWKEKFRFATEQLSYIEKERLESYPVYPHYLMFVSKIWHAKLGESFFQNKMAQGYVRKLWAAYVVELACTPDEEEDKQVAESILLTQGLIKPVTFTILYE
ncbi:hypothetical protein DL96DRAFT_101394 [Flagelloscypha sp. PMI_526]|nr:hypothetical protein DL96DRAFT_101394 [Flagelloscypha sp. PMI_526]